MSGLWLLLARVLPGHGRDPAIATGAQGAAAPSPGLHGGSGPTGTSAVCPHGMSAKARALLPCTEGEGKMEGVGEREEK